MRRHFLDNIRWCTVVLVVVYHVFYLFNACGVLGGVGGYADIQYQDALLPFVYPWFMVLLFAVAGISARYALERKSSGAFLKARTVKLLVPATLGLFVYHWITGWTCMTIGGGLSAMEGVPGPVLYLIAALSGTGPLWFAQLLWLYSLALVLLSRLDRERRLPALCGRCPLWAVTLLWLPLWGAAQVGNMPVITTYRLGVYAMAFALGYLFLSHDRVQEGLARHWPALTAVALATGIAYTGRSFGGDYTAGALLGGLMTNFYAWTATLAVLALFKRWFDFATPFTGYMTRSSFGLYVLHYLPLLLAAWGLRTATALPPWVTYPLCVLAGLAGGLGLWEVFRRIPVLRWAVLGITKLSVTDEY